jgi:hypothetical protein
MRRRTIFRWLGRAAIPLGGCIIVLSKTWGPLGAIVALLGAVGPIVEGYRWASGTALRPVVIWGMVAIGLGIVAQVVGLGESWETGRPGAGHWAYGSALASVAALLSAFNARRPGAGAWAFLMAALVVVLLIPWLENSGFSGHVDPWDRLRLGPPWSWFLGGLAVTALSNYLPTRFGPAVLPGALAFAATFWGLTATDRPHTMRGLAWAVGPWATAATLVVAEACAGRGRVGATTLERAWFWFRDHWGVVWGLRVAERFNESARARGWPFRLTWHGLVSSPGSSPAPPVPDEAEALFVSLLRRFADASRVEAESANPLGPSEMGPGVAR